MAAQLSASENVSGLNTKNHLQTTAFGLVHALMTMAITMTARKKMLMSMAMIMRAEAMSTATRMQQSMADAYIVH